MGVFNVDDYLSLAETQHSPRPKFMAVLRKYLEHVQAASDIAESMHENFSVDTGEGDQLDVIGQIVGVNRNYPYQGAEYTTESMDDDQYRLVLRATIAKDAWSGTFHSYADTWNEIFSGQAVSAVVVDRAVTSDVGDKKVMACRVYIDGDFDDDIARLITAGYVFPKPMGVEMDYAVKPQGDRTGYATTKSGAYVAFIQHGITIEAQELPNNIGG